MKRILLCSCLLLNTLAFSQNYQWQWAKSGGGNARGLNESPDAYWQSSEQIFDIITDSENNYYYLATISQGNTHIAGQPVTTYNGAVAGNDIAIFATNCEGEYLWSRIIGGSQQDTAYKLAVDNHGGIYTAVNVLNSAYEGSNLFPPRFSDNNSLPYTPIDNSLISEAWKTSFLLKYNAADGSLLWRKNLQGAVNSQNRNANAYQVAIDSNGILHLMVGYSKGTHLNGAITVPDTFSTTYQYYIVKFDAQGNLQGSPIVLPAAGTFLDYHTDFRYNENLNTYYIAGTRNNGGGTFLPLAYNNITIEGRSYVLAINAANGSERWRKEMNTTDTQFDDSRIYDLKIDSNNDIYIGGKFFNTGNAPLLFGTHTLSNNLTGNIPFILKMNSNGDVQWSKVPSAYIDPLVATGRHAAYEVALNGNEVALATHGRSSVWDAFSIDRPQGHRTDPVLIRFSKQNGNVIGLHDIMSMPGFDDAITAVTADNDGNYAVGGYFRYNLFSNNPNSIPTLLNTAGTGSYTDFFFAKLAATECGVPLSSKAFGKTSATLYPNPSADVVYIDSPETILRYELYNLLGQRLYSNTLVQNEQSISLQNLASGTYFVKLLTRQGASIIEKIIKK